MIIEFNGNPPASYACSASAAPGITPANNCSVIDGTTVTPPNSNKMCGKYKDHNGTWHPAQN
jgi:hypothetical protein